MSDNRQYEEEDKIATKDFSEAIHPPIETMSKEEAKEITQQQELDEFLAKEENKQNAFRLANQIDECVRGRWFTIDRLMVKSGETKMTAFQKIQLCKMFGLVQQRIGTYNDGRENLRQPLFKITIDNKDRIKAFEQIIQYHRDQIAHFELQIKQLQQ